MKLNYREKVILAVVLFIAIAALGFFALIKPKNQDIKDDTVVRDETQATWDEIESRIVKIPDLQDSILDTHSKIQTLTDKFVRVSDISNARKVDQYMQEYANDCDVRISSLTVGSLSESSVSYYYMGASSTRSTMVAADINGDMQQAVNDSNVASNYISARSTGTALSAQYGVTVTGTKENIWKYMKKIEDLDETILINSVAISDYKFTQGLDDDENQPAEGENPANNNDEEEPQGESQVTFVITLYSMYEMPKPNVE